MWSLDVQKHPLHFIGEVLGAEFWMFHQGRYIHLLCQKFSTFLQYDSTGTYLSTVNIVV